MAFGPRCSHRFSSKHVFGWMPSGKKMAPLDARPKSNLTHEDLLQPGMGETREGGRGKVRGMASGGYTVFLNVRGLNVSREFG